MHTMHARVTHHPSNLDPNFVELMFCNDISGDEDQSYYEYYG